MSSARTVATAVPWLAPAAVVIVGAALTAAMLRPAGERGLIEGGAAYTVVTYDLVLPLVGLGVALATVTRWQLLVAAVIFAGSVPLGIFGEHRLLSATGLSPDLARHFTYLGPLCCVAAGVALALSDDLRRWVTPAAALLCGAVLGFLAALHDPTLGDPRFTAAAAVAGLWFVAAPPTVLRWFRGRWLTIGGRILASWLVAIGLLLGGSKLVLQQRADRMHAQAPLFVQPPASLDPGTDSETGGFSQPREWGDPSRQP